MRFALALFAGLLCAQTLPVRPVPPPGVPVSDNDRADIAAGLARLKKSIDALGSSALLPDVRIFHEAVRVALTYNEFFRPEEIGRARELLRQGQQRADDLLAGRAPWTTATGLVVRGYISKIDKSVQPYGLVIPSGAAPRQWRLDCWFHGRAETLSELAFLYDRQRLPGEFTPEGAIVLHLYGRHNNANKFAGEVDLFEAIEAVKRHYPVDDNRIVVRGFSMGGAAAWQFATHFAGDWVAAAPGAGFSESPQFLNIAKDPIQPTWWEKVLWRMYNATDYAANLANTAVVAYSGEIDRQKQAADMMEKAMAAEGMRLTHIIGPNTPHRYHPDSKVAINERIDAIAARGRDPYPRRVRLTTYTLRYNRQKWVTVDALNRHWERARLDAEVADGNIVHVKAENVAAFSLKLGAGAPLLDIDKKVRVVINDQPVTVDGPWSDGSWSASFVRGAKTWRAGTSGDGVRKRHALQGPIDDAFMDSFVFVLPTGAAMHSSVEPWVKAESARAIKEWRRHFRGEPQVRHDSAITDAEIASSNLVLWGDPGSNKVLARIIDKLPVKWTAGQITIGSANYPASTHVPLLIYPNPLNPNRYVVLNSGFTYREFEYLNNAREVPKLPDWAIVDTTTPPDARFPGKIVDANFFDESWRFTAQKPSL